MTPRAARWDDIRSVHLLSHGSLGVEQRDSRQERQTEGDEKGKPCGARWRGVSWCRGRLGVSLSEPEPAQEGELALPQACGLRTGRLGRHTACNNTQNSGNGSPFCECENRTVSTRKVSGGCFAAPSSQARRTYWSDPETAGQAALRSILAGAEPQPGSGPAENAGTAHGGTEHQA